MGYKSKFKGSTVEERLRAVLKKQDTLVSGQNIKTIVGESVLGEGDLDITKVLYQSIDYQSLLNLREESKLKPGQFYRITDYVTRISLRNSQSAGHPFDVIVLALTNDTLAERAWACHRDGDTYFQNSHLEAWQLWYCLDNDTSRFEWAVPTSEGGKGVIYRMIDEWNNDVPYDFKNIQFTHPNDAATYPHYYYTFASGNVKANTDNSLSIANNCYSNTIRERITDGIRKLNHIIFIGSGCYSNSFGSGCYSNSFGSGCYSNSFGRFCNSNSFGDGCNSNSFGDSCYSNSFGDSCYSNSFGNSCDYNHFGSNCYDNSFGNYCYSNFFGNNCYYNSFGNNCASIKFASDGTSTTKYDFYQYNHFGDGCQYIVFKGAAPSSPENCVQNYNIAQGLQGVYNKYLTIDGTRNRAYETKVAKNSSGVLKIYCEADLVQA